MNSSVILAMEDQRVPELLRQGSIGVIPTDTIYGLAVAADNRQAVARLYQLKRREHKPGTIIAAGIDQLIQLGIDKNGLQTMQRYWPGPVSIVIDASAAAGYLHQDVGSLAVRIPNDAALLHLLQQTGPLVTTSANQPGEAPANTVAEAQAHFGDQVDFYVDGGDRSGRPPSTVARYKDGKLTVLRHGAAIIDR